MALIDRIFHDDPATSISNHAFSAALWFFAQGQVTRSQVVTAFNMDAIDEVQLDELITYYQALSNQDKRKFHSDIEAAGILAESGLITKALYKSFLGMV